MMRLNSIFKGIAIAYLFQISMVNLIEEVPNELYSLKDHKMEQKLCQNLELEKKRVVQNIH